jgi:hypothetical protein
MSMFLEDVISCGHQAKFSCSDPVAVLSYLGFLRM